MTPFCYGYSTLPSTKEGKSCSYHHGTRDFSQ